MHQEYSDITTRIEEDPKWWDENGVPRYDTYSPSEGPDIYAYESCLLQIECQDCHTRFQVGISHGPMKMFRNGILKPNGLEESVRNGSIHYGDPPNSGCCAAGPTMNSIPIRVLEFWKRDEVMKWVRVPELEIEIPHEWAKRR